MIDGSQKLSRCARVHAPAFISGCTQTHQGALSGMSTPSCFVPAMQIGGLLVLPVVVVVIFAVPVGMVGVGVGVRVGVAVAAASW